MDREKMRKTSTYSPNPLKGFVQRIYVKLIRRLRSMDDCIFCKLANGDIPTDMVYQDDKIAVFIFGDLKSRAF